VAARDNLFPALHQRGSNCLLWALGNGRKTSYGLLQRKPALSGTMAGFPLQISSECTVKKKKKKKSYKPPT